MPEFSNSFHKLGTDFYSETDIEPFDNPVLIDINKELAEELGLQLTEQQWLDFFSGNKIIQGSKPVSTVYAGHQFGSFVPQLGDGRAHLLGEIKSRSGRTYEMQLKGSGKTPFSRFGDGKAVLRSSVREYLAAEAMHYLGIPTTRSLCLIGSDENVMRESIEKAAMVTRVAPSFIRFGHFEYFTHNNKPEHTVRLLDFTIETYFPKLKGKENIYEKFFYEVVTSTARLMAKWQAFGFTHGVMNTDNVSILGLTVDYGPYGFMDEYQPGFIPNHSDYSGRYSYMNQPLIAHWNLRALSYALTPAIPLEKAAPIIELYSTIFANELTMLMRKKLGLSEKRTQDKKLIQDLLEVLAAFEVDYTLFFRALSDYKIDGDNNFIYSLFKKPDAFKDWESRYVIRIKQEKWFELNHENNLLDHQRSTEMKNHNPKYILRNYLAENAIRNATFAGDYSEVKKLREILKKPFDEQPEYDNYAALPPDWSKSLSISCSS